MLSVPSDSEKAVPETITMKMHVKLALEHLENVGHPMAERTYFRYKIKVSTVKVSFTILIASVKL